jgi:hypothetical protein
MISWLVACAAFSSVEKVNFQRHYSLKGLISVKLADGNEENFNTMLRECLLKGSKIDVQLDRFKVSLKRAFL